MLRRGYEANVGRRVFRETERQFRCGGDVTEIMHVRICLGCMFCRLLSALSMHFYVVKVRRSGGERRKLREQFTVSAVTLLSAALADIFAFPE